MRQELRILAEDRPLEPPQLRPGLDAEILEQRRSRIAIRVESFGLPAAAIEGEHEQAAKPFAIRVPGDQALQLRDDSVVRAFVEVEVDPPLGRGKTEVFEARSLGNGERGVDAYEGRPAPELEGGARSLLPELQELGEVELAGRDPERVAVADRLDPPRSEHLPEPVDCNLKRVLGASRWILAPVRIDQHVAPDDLVRVQEQEGKE